jgi:hypothetical protein
MFCGSKCLFVMKQVLTFIDVYQGVLPDIPNRKFHGHPIVIAASICLPIVIILTLMRIYVRLHILHKWTLDDCKSLAPELPFSLFTKPRYIHIECGAFRCELLLQLRRF